MDRTKPIAIITGASTGIGKHVSVNLASHGYNVILISRNKGRLQKVEEEIKGNGHNCSSIVADISNINSVKNIYKQIDKPHKIDVIVNNAGIGIFNKIQNISLEEWDQQINTNLRGSFLMTKMVINDMIKNKAGKIVFINSVAGINPYPFSSAYVASKYGLRGFSASLREELREYKIKVISIHPGAVDTPFWNNVKGDFPREEMLAAKDVAKTITESILSPNNMVCEEIVIRRSAGDF